jgi:hypothetical protein
MRSEDSLNTRSSSCCGHENRNQLRCHDGGWDGLLRDKTRKPGKKPLPKEMVQRVIDLALGPPPGEVIHWTGRMLAMAAEVSLPSVQRILEANQLAPHRVRTFKLSNDPKFAEKVGSFAAVRLMISSRLAGVMRAPPPHSSQSFLRPGRRRLNVARRTARRTIAQWIGTLTRRHP